MKDELLLDMPSDLRVAINLVYEPCQLVCKNLKREAESQEYDALTFEMNNIRIKFRVGKITSTKVGQFVTLWKRIGDGVILPHDLDDPVDLFIISVRRGEKFGQFVFPKTVLVEKGILSKEGKGGKRAMRIYPPWDVTNNRQANKTQIWQLRYFFEIPTMGTINIDHVQKLFQPA